ncbi:MAG: hypothetical protein R3Y06_10725, partial [Faecalibacterium sp.]
DASLLTTTATGATTATSNSAYTYTQLVFALELPTSTATSTTSKATASQNSAAELLTKMKTAITMTGTGGVAKVQLADVTTADTTDASGNLVPGTTTTGILTLAKLFTQNTTSASGTITPNELTLDYLKFTMSNGDTYTLTNKNLNAWTRTDTDLTSGTGGTPTTSKTTYTTYYVITKRVSATGSTTTQTMKRGTTSTTGSSTTTSANVAGTEKSASTVSLGIGIAVAVVLNTVQSVLNAGVIDVGGLSLNASADEYDIGAIDSLRPSNGSEEQGLAALVEFIEGKVDEYTDAEEEYDEVLVSSGSLVRAIAGFSAGSVSIGGAIAVNIVNNLAQSLFEAIDTANDENDKNADGTAKQLSVTLADGADLNVSASATTTNSTSATSQQSEGVGDVGVGAGIAVSVEQTYAYAIVDAPVQIAGDILGDITVTASQDITSSVEASAGSAAGISVTPSLALLVAENETAALVSGNFVNQLADGTTTAITAQSANINAISVASRSASSDASAAGESVAVGMAVSLIVADDVTTAYLMTSLFVLGALNVFANSTVKNVATSTAGASGGESTEDDDAATSNSNPNNMQTTLLSNGSTLKTINTNSAKTGATASTTSSATPSTTDTDPTNAETTEGTISVAGAFTVLVTSTVVQAVIEAVNDGALELAADQLQVVSAANIDTSAKANASVTQSSVGVGVGVAVNTANWENTARIKNANITANQIVVLAGMVSTDDASSFGTSDDSEGDSSNSDESDISIWEEVGNNAKSSAISGASAVLSQGTVSSVTNTLKSVAASSINTIKADILSSLFATETESTTEQSNEFITSAVAGVGASSVGVAGAAAIAVIIGNVSASVEGCTINVYDEQMETTKTEDALTIANLANGSVIVGTQVNVKVDTLATTSATNEEGDKDTTDPTDTSSASGGSGGGATTEPEASSSVGVGAAAAINFITITLNAELKDTTVHTGAIRIGSDYTGVYSAQAVSGTDPLSNSNTEANYNDYALDASVAVNIATANVYASITNSNLFTYGTNTVQGVVIEDLEGDDLLEELEDILENGSDWLDENLGTDIEFGDEEEIPTVYPYYNVYVYAHSVEDTLSKASSAAVGGSAAVGAAVAVNVLSSEVAASVSGSGDLAGDLGIVAHALNSDDAYALASSMGASAAQNAAKIAGTADKADDVMNNGVDDALSSSYTQTGTNSSVSSAASASASPTPTASAGTSVSNNILAQNPVNGVATDSSGAGAESATTDESGSINLAAALAFVLADHQISATLSGEFTTTKVVVEALNENNFNSTATGIAVTDGTAIAVAVAITINESSAIASIEDATITTRVDDSVINQDGFYTLEETDEDGNVIATTVYGEPQADGSITVHARTTQNQNGDYVGRMAAQAIAGGVSQAEEADASTSSSTQVGIAGAAAVVYNSAQTIATVVDSALNAEGDVNVNAEEKTRIAIRAGALSVVQTGSTSSSSAVGIGASFAFAYAQSELEASIKGDSSVTAQNLDVIAAREEVTINDYQTAVSLSSLFTVDEDGNVSFNFDSTENLLELINLFNFLSSVNYYCEAIAGGVSTGQSSNAVSGSFALLMITYTTLAEIDESVLLTIADTVNVLAKDEVTTRLIAGSAAVTTGKHAAGVTLSGVYDEGAVTASMGAAEGSELGSLLVDATSVNDILGITFAMAVSTGSNNGSTVGGGINVIIQDMDVLAEVKDNANFTVNQGDAEVHAISMSKLINVLASLSGSNSATALGGSVGVVLTEGSATAAIGDNVTLQVTGEEAELSVNALVKETLINIVASASAALGSSGTSANAVIAVQSTTSEAAATVGNDTTIVVEDGDILIIAQGDVLEVFVIVGMALSSASSGVTGTGVVSTAIFERNLIASVGDRTTLTANNGDIIIMAVGEDTTIVVTMGLAAGTGSSTAAGAIGTIVGQNNISATVGEDSVLTAGDTIVVLADLDTLLIQITGAISATSSGTLAAGGSIATSVLQSIVKAYVADNSTLVALTAPTANGWSWTRDEKRLFSAMGVSIYANSEELFVFATIAASLTSSGTALSGVVSTVVASNTVTAGTGKGVTIKAETQQEAALGEVSETDDAVYLGISIYAAADTFIVDGAGIISISASGSAVGASAAVLVLNKTVSASVGANNTFSTGYDILVHANSYNDLYMVEAGVAGSASTSVAATGGALYFKDVVTASIDDSTEAAQGSFTAQGDITVETISYATIILVVGSIAASTGGAGVGGVVEALIFMGTTEAYVGDWNILTADGAIAITADSDELIVATGASAGVSGGSAGVAGTIVVVVTEVITTATTGDYVTLTAGEAVRVVADDYYELYAIIGSTGVSAGSAGVGVAAAISIVKNTITASLGAYNNVTAPSGLDIQAISNRNVSSYGISAGASSSVGAAFIILVTVVGANLTEEATEALYADGNPDVNETISALFASAILSSDTSAESESVSVEGTDDVGETSGGDATGSAAGALSYVDSSNATANETVNAHAVDAEIEEIKTENASTDFDSNPTGLDADSASDLDVVGDSNYESDNTHEQEYTDSEGATATETVGNSTSDDIASGDVTIDGTEYSDADALNESMSSSQKTYDPANAVSATVGAGSTLTVGTLLVNAAEGNNIDQIAAALAFGSSVAGAVGVVIGIVYSNVIAQVGDDVTIITMGDVTVTATSSSEEVSESATPGKTIEGNSNLESLAGTEGGAKLELTSVKASDVVALDDENENTTLDEDGVGTSETVGVTSSDIDLSSFTIRAISIVLSGSGSVAVGGAVAFIMLSSVVEASMGAVDIQKADGAGEVDVLVSANGDYGTNYAFIVAVSISAGGGYFSASATSASVVVDADVSAQLGEYATLGSAATPLDRLTVESYLVSHMIAAGVAAAVAASAAGAAVVLNVVVALNTAQNTAIIHEGSEIYLNQDATVIAQTVASAITAMASLAASAYASITINVNVVMLEAITTASASGTIVTPQDITVLALYNVDASGNKIGTGLATANALAVSGAIVGINFAIALVFHNAETYAYLNAENGSISADNILVKANSITFTQGGIISVAGGVVGVTVTALYLDVQSVTEAELHLEGGSVTANDLDVMALGTNQIIALNISASGGVVAVGAGASVAKLRGTISSTITGQGTLTVANDIDVIAKDLGDSYVIATGGLLTGGAVAIGLNLAIALLDGVLEAGIDADDDGTLTISAATLNILAEKEDGQTIATTASAAMGAVTLIASLSLAISQDTVRTILDGVVFADVSKVSAVAQATSMADANTAGLGYGGVNIGVNSATAINRISVTATATRISGTVGTLSIAANSNVESTIAALAAVGAVAASAMAGVNANTAIAITESTVGASLGIQDTLSISGDLSVTAIDNSRSQAYAISVAAGAAGVGVNYVQSTNSSVVYALLSGGSIIGTGSNAITVSAKFNDGIENETEATYSENEKGEVVASGTQAASTALAVTVSGAAGAVGVNLNAVWAQSLAEVSAGLSDISISGVDTLTVQGVDASRASAYGIALTAGAGSASTLNTIAIAGGSLTVWANPGEDNTITANTLNVTADSNTAADSILLSGNIGVAAVTVNYAEASLTHASAASLGDLSGYTNNADHTSDTTKTEGTVVYKDYESSKVNSDTPTAENAITAGAGIVKASSITVNATAKGYAVATSVSVSVGLTNVGANVSVANNNATVQSVISGVSLAGDRASVTASYNEGGTGSAYVTDAAYAGIASASAGTYNGSANYANAYSISNVQAGIFGSTGTITGDLLVSAIDESTVSADVVSASIGGASMGANIIKASNVVRTSYRHCPQK